MIRGCVHYGVKQSWIDYLKSLPVQPRKKASEFKKLPEPPAEHKVYTLAELAANNGQDGKELWMAINFKVMKHVPDAKVQGPMPVSWFRDNVGGKDATLVWAKGLYEPLYPIATTVKEMVPEHRALIEDMAAGRMLTNFEVIGVLEPYA